MTAEEHIRNFPKAEPIFSFMRGEFREILASRRAPQAIRKLYSLKLAQFQNNFEVWQNEKELGPVNESFKAFMENAADDETAPAHFQGLFEMLKSAGFQKEDVWGAMNGDILQNMTNKRTGKHLTRSESEEIGHAAAEAIQKVFKNNL